MPTTLMITLNLKQERKREGERVRERENKSAIRASLQISAEREARQADRSTATVACIIYTPALEFQRAHGARECVSTWGESLFLLLRPPLQLWRPLQPCASTSLRIPLQKGAPSIAPPDNWLPGFLQARMQCGGRSTPKSPWWFSRCDPIVPYTWRPQTSKAQGRCIL